MQIRSLLLSVAMFTGALAIPPGLTEVLTKPSELSTFAKLLIKEQEPLFNSLDRNSGYTILAPTDKAFEAFFASSQGARFKDNPSAIFNLLEYHVLQGEFFSSAFTHKPAFVHTLLQDSEYTDVTGGQVVEVVRRRKFIDIISGELQISKIIKPDLKYGGGVVHIIDKVLTIPESLSLTAATKGYTAFGKAFATIEALSDVTVFVPSNAAYKTLLSKHSSDDVVTLLDSLAVQEDGSVSYTTNLKDGEKPFTLNGEQLKISVKNRAIFVNDLKITTENVLTANGVIHVIG